VSLLTRCLGIRRSIQSDSCTSTVKCESISGELHMLITLRRYLQAEGSFHAVLLDSSSHSN
jgi:hypothetical protein